MKGLTFYKQGWLIKTINGGHNWINVSNSS